MDRSVIRQDALDHLQFDQLVNQFPDMVGATDHHNYTQSWELCSDLFASVYQHFPEKNDPVGPAFKLNEKFIDGLLPTREYQDLHDAVKGRKVLSMMAASDYYEDFSKGFTKEEKDFADQASAWYVQQQNLKREEKIWQRIQAKGGVDVSVDLAEVQTRLGELEEKLANLQVPEVSENRIRRSSRQAAQKALARVEEAQSLMSAFNLSYGTEEGLGLNDTNGSNVQALRSLLDDARIKRIADLAGKFKRIAMAKRQNRLSHGPDEVTGVEMGNSLERVIPSELAYLTDPDTETYFFKKLVNQELIQTLLQAKEPEGRGPIIYFADVSGSMRGGGKDEWAKAVGLALLAVALKEKRDCYLGTFDTKVNEPYVFLKGEANLAQIQSFIADFSGGGTQLMAPLMATRNILAEKEFKDADLILATDGVSGLDNALLDQFLKFKQERQLNVISVFIGHVDAGAKVLDRFSDQIIHMVDLTDEKQMGQMLALH